MPDSAPATTLTHAEQRALHYIEQVYQYTREWPNIEKLPERFPTFDLQKALRKPAFVNGLTNRGLPLPNPVDSVETLTKEQIAAVATVLNWDDKRSRAAKLREIGVSPTKWAGWLRNKQFKDYLNTISASNFEDAVDHAHSGLVTAMDKGNTEAIKYFMEVTGRYTASNAEVVNLKAILSRLVEVVQRHVDPVTLTKINRDFDLVLQGQTIEENQTRVIEAI